MSVRKTINDTDFWFCLLDPSISHVILDEDGNETGEPIPHYEEAVAFFANVSPAGGLAQEETFGKLDAYDRVLVSHDTACPIEESTVLFLDKEPEYTTVQTHEIVEGNALFADDEIEPVEYRIPTFDYVVKRVAKSKNEIQILVSKVTVS